MKTALPPELSLLDTTIQRPSSLNWAWWPSLGRSGVANTLVSALCGVPSLWNQIASLSVAD
jgi:hypothetical protein